LGNRRSKILAPKVVELRITGNTVGPSILQGELPIAILGGDYWVSELRQFTWTEACFSQSFGLEQDWSN
jgi:hypothetical protein